MIENYKGHEIQVLAWEIDGNWQPKLGVVWSEDDQKRVKYLKFIQVFPTEEQTIRAALRFAKKWIDGGKPDL